MGCLSEDAILDFVEGRARGGDFALFNEHVSACDECRELVAHAISASATLAEVDVSLGNELENGDEVGRYVIGERVGQGAMGVVFMAHDPQLDRRVALKLLRDDASGAETVDARRTRLLREAQAMARVAHPNVVTVYDAGVFGSHVFVAMELVDGDTLAKWMRAEKRPWRVVLGVLVQAGRGLAAAHDAGLVHRDFKPQNVLMGPDGRPRVTDFGLARPVDAADTSRRRETPSKLLGTTVTTTGVIVGTPAYMAPEQFVNGPTDARTDQFSFCVTAWEALFGARPFPGKTFSDIAASVHAGTIVSPNRGDVPEEIVAALRRGLSKDPAERHASMAALITALERTPRRASRAWIAAPLVAIAAVTTWVAWPRSQAHVETGAPTASPATQTASIAQAPPQVVTSAPTSTITTTTKTSVAVTRPAAAHHSRPAVSHPSNGSDDTALKPFNKP